MFDIPTVEDIQQGMSPGIEIFNATGGETRPLASYVRDLIVAITGSFPVRLLCDVPVGAEHEMTKGREVWAARDKTGAVGAWVRGYQGEPVRIHPHEYEEAE